MRAGRIEELVAFSLAREFKLEVYRLVDSTTGTRRDFKFEDQIRDAASGVERALNEGFHRKLDTEFVHFIRYALGSLGEAKGHIEDGIHRGHFVEADCRAAFSLANRCKAVTTALLSSLRLAIERERMKKKRKR